MLFRCPMRVAGTQSLEPSPLSPKVWSQSQKLNRGTLIWTCTFCICVCVYMYVYVQRGDISCICSLLPKGPQQLGWKPGVRNSPASLP